MGRGRWKGGEKGGEVWKRVRRWMREGGNVYLTIT